MSLLDQISKDLKQAMKDRDSERVSDLRMLVSALKYEKIEQGGELERKVEERVLRKEAKKRREAIELYKKGKRDDLAKKEEIELELIQGYLPEMMGEEEVRAKVKEILRVRDLNNFGQAMGKVMAELKGKAEGGMVSKIVKEEFKR